MFDPLNNDIGKYCEEHSSSTSPLLQYIERETHLRTLKPRMISGRLLGQFYAWLVSWNKPESILEIGTFTGYTTISLAERMGSSTIIDTIEINPESHWLANQFFSQYEKKDQIHSHLGDARVIIDDIQYNWDFIIIDAAKKDNLFYFKKLLERLTPHGIMIVDNTLWSGKVLDLNPDKKTQNIKEFNKIIANDDRIEKILLPIEDGITIIQKK